MNKKNYNNLLDSISLTILLIIFIVRVILMLLFSVSIIYHGGFLNQTVIIEDSRLILKNLYGIMFILNQEDIENVETVRLPTYYSWVI